MPVIRLPDGAEKRFDAPVTVAEIAASIGAGLGARRARGEGGRQAGRSQLSHRRRRRVAIVTERDPEGLEILRHSTAHLLAQAVKELFPDAQVTIGPVIENGFYYDFSFKRPFTPEDLAAIEQRMAEIAKRDLKVEREVMGARRGASTSSRAKGEHYKAEIIAAHPGQASDLALSPGQLHRPVPRAARALARAS